MMFVTSLFFGNGKTHDVHGFYKLSLALGVKYVPHKIYNATHTLFHLSIKTCQYALYWNVSYVPRFSSQLACPANRALDRFNNTN